MGLAHKHTGASLGTFAVAAAVFSTSTTKAFHLQSGLRIAGAGQHGGSNALCKVSPRHVGAVPGVGRGDRVVLHLRWPFGRGKGGERGEGDTREETREEETTGVSPQSGQDDDGLLVGTREEMGFAVKPAAGEEEVEESTEGSEGTALPAATEASLPEVGVNGAWWASPRSGDVYLRVRYLKAVLS